MERARDTTESLVPLLVSAQNLMNSMPIQYPL
jgi:hypothetical protein